MRDLLNKAIVDSKNKISYNELPKFPSVLRDISFTVGSDVNAAQINEVLNSFKKKNLKGYKVFDYYPINSRKSFTYSLEFYDNEKTLNDEEVNKLQEELITALGKKLNAELRS